MCLLCVTWNPLSICFGGGGVFFSFWLCWVFIAVRELSRAAASGDSSPAAVHRLPAAASLVVCRLSSCGA